MNELDHLSEILGEVQRKADLTSIQMKETGVRFGTTVAEKLLKTEDIGSRQEIIDRLQQASDLKNEIVGALQLATPNEVEEVAHTILRDSGLSADICVQLPPADFKIPIEVEETAQIRVHGAKPVTSVDKYGSYQRINMQGERLVVDWNIGIQAGQYEPKLIGVLHDTDGDKERRFSGDIKDTNRRTFVIRALEYTMSGQILKAVMAEPIRLDSQTVALRSLRALIRSVPETQVAKRTPKIDEEAPSKTQDANPPEESLPIISRSEFAASPEVNIAITAIRKYLSEHFDATPAVRVFDRAMADTQVVEKIKQLAGFIRRETRDSLTDQSKTDRMMVISVLLKEVMRIAHVILQEEKQLAVNAARPLTPEERLVALPYQSTSRLITSSLSALLYSERIASDPTLKAEVAASIYKLTAVESPFIVCNEYQLASREALQMGHLQESLAGWNQRNHEEQRQAELAMYGTFTKELGLLFEQEQAKLSPSTSSGGGGGGFQRVLYW